MTLRLENRTYFYFIPFTADGLLPQTAKDLDSLLLTNTRDV